MSEEKEIIISDYFIEVVDEGGGTVDYKVLPNTERLLVDKIFTQNQYIDRLQQENEVLKDTLRLARDIADIIANANCYPVKEAKNIIKEINEVLK